jgi:hypothetical protein
MYGKGGRALRSFSATPVRRRRDLGAEHRLPVHGAPEALLDPVRRSSGSAERVPRPVVLGGAGYSFSPEERPALPGRGRGDPGEGETVFPLLAGRIARGGRPSMSPASSCRGPPRLPELREELDGLPLRSRRSCCRPASTRGSSGSRPDRGAARWTALLFDRRDRGRRCGGGRPSDRGSWRSRRDAGCRRIQFRRQHVSTSRRPTRRSFAAKTPGRLDIESGHHYPKWVDAEHAGLLAEAAAQVSFGFESAPTGCPGVHQAFPPGGRMAISKMIEDAGVRRNSFQILGCPAGRGTRRGKSFVRRFPDRYLKITAGVRSIPDGRWRAPPPGRGLAADATCSSRGSTGRGAFGLAAGTGRGIRFRAGMGNRLTGGR